MWRDGTNGSGAGVVGVDVRVSAAELQATAKGMASHPLVRRLYARMDATGDLSLHTPADVLGERLAILAGVLATQVTRTPDGVEEPVDEDRRYVNAAITAFALEAEPYLWLTPVVREAQHVDLPSHVVSRSVLPTRAMWWTYALAFPLMQSGTSDGGTDIHDCHLLLDELEGIGIYAFGAHRTDEGQVPAMHQMFIPYGSRVPDDVQDWKNWPVKMWLLKLLAFLNSPYIPRRRERVQRAERRLAAPFGAVPDVTFMDLRLPTPGSQTPGEATGEGREWKHRWIVRGHNRAQWYPSEGAHHVIYIAPYIKGPEDAPLLEHVNRVKR